MHLFKENEGFITPGGDYFSSRSIEIAFFGHSFAQIPHPLQKSRSTSRSSLIAASGQNMAQMPQALHCSLSTTGLKTRQDPVFPEAPLIGLLIAGRVLIAPAPDRLLQPP
jgi:hypothetical protein